MPGSPPECPANRSPHQLSQCPSQMHRGPSHRPSPIPFVSRWHPAIGHTVGHTVGTAAASRVAIIPNGITDTSRSRPKLGTSTFELRSRQGADEDSKSALYGASTSGSSLSVSSKPRDLLKASDHWHLTSAHVRDATSAAGNEAGAVAPRRSKPDQKPTVDDRDEITEAPAVCTDERTEADAAEWTKAPAAGNKAAAVAPRTSEPDSEPTVHGREERTEAPAVPADERTEADAASAGATNFGSRLLTLATGFGRR